MGLTARIAWLLIPLAAALPASPPAGAQALPAASAVGQVPAAEDDRLIAQLRANARALRRLDVLGAITRDPAADPAQLNRLFSDELAAAQRAALGRNLRALGTINRALLSPERQLSYDSAIYQTQESLRWYAPDLQALVAVRPFTHFGGLHQDFPALIAPGSGLPYASRTDYDHALALVRGFAPLIDRAIARFRQGMDSGVVETRLTTTNMIAQIDAILARSDDQSPFAAPLEAMPEDLPARDRTAIRNAWFATIRDDVNPAYRRLRAFLADEYLPSARDGVGLAAMKGGADLYRRLIERHTTLSLDPDAVHALGLSEVARIKGEMTKVQHQLGDTGDLDAFFDRIRTDPRFHPRSALELAQGFSRVATTVEAQLPRFFDRLPRATLTIAPYPEYRARFEAGGSYAQGSPDGLRSGTFYFNTYDLPSRFTSGITTLYLHEGMPGHHLQTSLAQEDASLPDNQRFGDNAAYVEGWALYAETLGYEMGLYRDPLQHWGTLDDEMLRAMRLVVDTGLHAKGWSRDQAVAYMLANSGMGRSDAEAEVDRYIANPAQALSYKIGAMTIQRLRREAEAALGPKFDLKAFHNQILGSGVLPLPVLEAKVRRWIAASRPGN